MTPKFSQTHQDDRVWALERLIRYEGHLDPRMYECAQLNSEQRDNKDCETLYKLWEDWKERIPANPHSQLNRL